MRSTQVSAQPLPAQALDGCLSAFGAAGFAQSRNVPRMRSRLELGELLHPEVDDLLRKFELRPAELAALRPLVMREGPEQAFLCVAIATCLGILPENIEEYFTAPPTSALLKPGSKALTYLMDPAWEHLFEIPAEAHGLVLRDSRAPGERVKLFQACFRAFPPVYGWPTALLDEHAGTFAMYLPKNKWREIRADSITCRFQHAPDAFAYIRFSLVHDQFVIQEIQSDAYSLLRKRSDRERYKHWAKQLLLAFEQYVLARVSNPVFEETGDADGPILPRIIIPGTAAIRAAWPDRPHPDSDYSDVENGPTLFGTFKIIPGIAPALAERLYADLPRSMGYQAVEDPDMNEHFQAQGVVWAKEMPYPKDCDAGLSTEENEKPHPYFHDQFVPHFAVREHQAAALQAQYEELFPKSFFCELRNGTFRPFHPTQPAVYANGRDQSLELAAAFERAPCVPVDLHEIHGITDQLTKHHQALMTQPAIQAAAQALSPDFCCFSRGIEGGISADWWKEIAPGRVAGLHIERQDRHPLVGLQLDDLESGRLWVGFKGGGLRTLSEAPIVVWGSIKHLRAPIYRLKGDNNEETIMPSHKFWGGLTVEFAKPEFINSLAVSFLMSRIDPLDTGYVPIPMDVAIPTAFPVWERGKTSWLSYVEYCRNILDEYNPEAEPQRLAVYRNACRAAVRLSQVINRIFKRTAQSCENLEDCELQIRTALQHLYQLHGENLCWPATGIKVRNSQVGSTEILNFLSEVHQLNYRAAERIIHRISARPLAVMAAVHGTGGHLGGRRTGSVGAVGGGAVTLRNIDALGCMHDLDTDTFLPWLSGRTRVWEAANRKYLQLMQMSDAMYLCDTFYWLEKVLRGSPNEQPAEAQEYKVGNHDYLRRLGPLEGQMQFSILQPKGASSFKYNLLRILGQERAALYERFHDLGAQFVKNDWQGLNGN